MRVQLFAGLAEAMGRRELQLAAPGVGAAGAAGGCTVAELDAHLRETFAALVQQPFRIAVNQRYASADERVGDDDEIALIPPVSGG